jgi:hypothetical protein
MSCPPANADHPPRRSGRAGPAIFALIGVFGLLLALGAGAAPLWKAALTSTDAGQSNTVTLSPNQTYELLCYGATGCWRVGDAGVTTDCAKDEPYPVVDKTGASTPTAARELPVRFTTFAGTGGNAPTLATRAWDAGNPNCQVYTLVGGANATGGALPLGPITPR